MASRTTLLSLVASGLWATPAFSARLRPRPAAHPIDTARTRRGNVVNNEPIVACRVDNRLRAVSTTDCGSASPPSQPYGNFGDTTISLKNASTTARDSRRLDFGNAPGRPLQRRVFLAKAQISVRLSHQLYSAILQLEIENAIKRDINKPLPIANSRISSRDHRPHHHPPPPDTRSSSHQPPNADPKTAPRKKEKAKRVYNPL